MEEKERYSYDYFIDGAVFIDTENDRDMDMDTVCSLLNQQNARINELQEENQHLKDKIEFLTTFKEVISEHKPAFCKLAGRDCEWLGKEKQLAISELENLKEKAFHFYVNDTPELTSFYVDVKEIDNQIKSLKGEEQ